MNISLSAFAPEIWSHETGSAVLSRVSLFISILRLNLVLTYGIPPGFRGGVHLFNFKLSYAIGSIPSLSGHATAYRWRSLPRVHRYRANKPQDSFEQVLPWQVTMDQLTCASLYHTHQLVCMYVCMCMVTPIARVWINRVMLPILHVGQLNRENEYFLVRVRASEYGLVRRVRQSRPASACSSPYLY